MPRLLPALAGLASLLLRTVALQPPPEKTRRLGWAALGGKARPKRWPGVS